MKISVSTAANRLKEHNNILIISHRRPDGDTIGSAMGLYYALKELGITSRVECSDPFPEKFSYMYKDYVEKDFTPEFIVTVDIASESLLGDLQEKYTGKIDLSIDHHVSNDFYAKETLLGVDCPAAVELIYLVVVEMGVTLNENIANALFTGLITDTGGFRFFSVTPQTHRVAASLIEAGAKHGEINQLIFESISKQRLQVEAFARNTMEYFFDDMVALLYLPADLQERFGVTEEEMDGITSLPRMIEGVNIGLTIRDQGNDEHRISVRSRPPYDSSAICQHFGGGGHVSAGGCTIFGKLEDAKAQLLKVVENEIKQANK